MKGQHYRLKATKTRLYELVERHYGTPIKCRQAEFVKYPESRDYALNCYYGGKVYHFFLAACGGKVILSCKIVDLDGGHSPSWDTVDISLAELLELGLAEPIPKKPVPQE